MTPRIEQVYFGAGAWRQVGPLFSALHGVTATRAGYMGGWTVQPSAEQVASGLTGHAEVVEVDFDTRVTSLRSLLKAFFSFHDATLDRRKLSGGQYRSVVFCRKAKQHIVTGRAIELLRANGLEVTTEVKDAGIFWPAEAAVRHHAQRARRYARAVPGDLIDEMSLVEAAKAALPRAA